MRKLIYLILLLTGINSTAQVAIELPAMNVVYIGLPNPINVVVQGVPREDLRFATKNCEVVDSSGQFYLFSFERGYADVWIMNQKGDTLDNRVMRSRSIPRPELSFGTLESGNFPRGIILAQPGIYGTLGEGFAYEGVSYYLDSAFVSIEGVGGVTVCKQQGAKLHPGISREMVQPFSRVMVWDAYVSQKTGIDQRSVSPLFIQCRDMGSEFMHYPESLDPQKLPELGQCLTIPFDSVTFIKDKKVHRMIVEPESIGKVQNKLHFIEGDTFTKVKNEYFKSFYPGNLIREEGEVRSMNDTILGKHIQGRFFRYIAGGTIELPQGKTDVESNIDYQMYPVGYWRYYHSNGELYAEGMYKIEKVDADDEGCYFGGHIPDFIYINRTGTWKFYDEDGNLAEEVKYD
ncbi:MAG: hypothetical protein GC180_09765 [Bacteroidetes bacterium]|nr:hypothetical protein [Bacteroidota bacterium]